MWTCALCCYAVELDDVLVVLPRGRCICVRCYWREVGDLRPMPSDVRAQLERLLASLP